jgi:hypothetical protein
MTRALEIAALALVAIAAATQHPLTGWNAGAHYALVQSLADGTPRIDDHLNQSGDIAYVDGHYYAAKSPGLAVLSLPVYAAFDATGSVTPTSPTGLGPPRARGIQEHALWQVNLVVVACFFCLLLLVRTAVGWVVPGAGLAVALILGLGTMLLPLATVYFSHVPSAMLGFAAFTLLLRARSRPGDPTIALAGLLAGLAVFMEVTLAVVAVCLGVYAVVMGPRLRRAALYGAGLVVGILPLAAYNWWAFGSPFENGYSHAVKELGGSGHAVIGANASGFFGVTHPRLDALREILVSERGFFAITPITVIALAGLVPLARRGCRPEAIVIGGTTLAMFVFNASYYLPMGGAAPGPRFLTPLLPLLALPLAAALRAWPLITIAGAAVSAFWMIVATVGEPILDPALAPTAWVAHVVHGTDLAQSIFGVGRTAELVFAVPVAFALFVGLLLPALLRAPASATPAESG